MKHIDNDFIFNESTDDKCFIYLNIDFHESLFRYLWSTTRIHAVADGAANRLYKMFPEEKEMFIPDYIIGDFDSISDSVLHFYRKCGSKCIKDANQDNTDLDKCLVHLSTMHQHSHVIIGGDLGGRFDHSFGIINSIMLANHFYSDIVLVGLGGTLRVLASGEYSISCIDKYKHKDSHTCGLIPLGGWLCDRVSTTGLKWDLHDTTMQFGGLVSTSNIMERDTITVSSQFPLIWTLSIVWDFL